MAHRGQNLCANVKSAGNTLNTKATAGYYRVAAHGHNLVAKIKSAGVTAGTKAKAAAVNVSSLVTEKALATRSLISKAIEGVKNKTLLVKSWISTVSTL